MSDGREARAPRRRLSMRAQLLIGILLPVVLIVAVNTVSLYRQALQSADTAYDRTLLASAKAIGELLEVAGAGDEARVRASVPYAALEPFEADNRSRLFYRVSGFRGEMVSGFEDLPAWRGSLPVKGPYAALVDFYDAEYRGEPVRMAVLLQPVAGLGGVGMATIQVAETLELRRTLAQRMLLDTVWRQAALIGVIAAVVVLVVLRATRPVRRVSAELAAREASDLSPIAAPDAPRELQPLLEAINDLMARLRRLLAHQKRFVRDTSHQLRTPLAVLKTQVQSALRGDVEAPAALREIDGTVERAVRLANQMLALAKVEQVHGQGAREVVDVAEVAREVALDLSPLIAEKHLDFELAVEPAVAVGHAWMLRELLRNLMANAVRATPPGGALTLAVRRDGTEVELLVRDGGPGIPPARRARLFEPFAASQTSGGAGLGLAICREICDSLGARLELLDREAGGRVTGLDARVRLPAAA